MIRFSLFCGWVLMITCLPAFGQTREAAFEMNERLGRGINIGNTFEAPTEDAWDNPWNAAYFGMISELGFKHVRVPVRWETDERSMSTSPYTISAAFLNRIQEVIDAALKAKLHIVFNMHHHDALFEDPEGQRQRFLSQWSQIADYFKGYPDSLLFEVLNEPHGNLTAPLWNEYFSAALDEIRKTNPTRIVLMGVAEYGGLGGISKLTLPDDENIILSVHYYNPFAFTHQGADWVSGANDWLGTEWLDTEVERSSVESEFAYALNFSETQNIPIHVGEFGAYSRADMNSRERWTTFLARWFEQKNLSWAYWEFSAGFGIYDPLSGQYVQGLVDALVHSEMPEPTPVAKKPVYVSNFTSGTDGWSLSLQGGAAGSAASASGMLNISITAGGTEAWHVQLVKSPVRLEKDKQYLISFSAQTQSDRSVTFYAGKASSPWNAYSGYNSVNLSTDVQAFTFIFNMTSTTDPGARLVFDLGLHTGSVTISGVKVEEIVLPVTATLRDDTMQKPAAYPNPASSQLWIENVNHGSAELFDLRGKKFGEFSLTPGLTRLDLGQIPSGNYLLVITGQGRKIMRKVIKK